MVQLSVKNKPTRRPIAQLPLASGRSSVLSAAAGGCPTGRLTRRRWCLPSCPIAKGPPSRPICPAAAGANSPPSTVKSYMEHAPVHPYRLAALTACARLPEPAGRAGYAPVHPTDRPLCRIATHSRSTTSTATSHDNPHPSCRAHHTPIPRTRYNGLSKRPRPHPSCRALRTHPFPHLNLEHLDSASPKPPRYTCGVVGSWTPPFGAMPSLFYQA